MIRIHLKNSNQEFEFQHVAGPLEFGRGPQRKSPRQIVNDPCVSSDQMVVEELGNEELRVHNLSEHVQVQIAGSEPVDLLETKVVPLPVQMHIGMTNVSITPVASEAESDGSEEPLEQLPACESAMTSLRDLGTAPRAETLARWFETLICVQQAAASSTAFYSETAKAVVDLVGLDRGLVLLREGDGWKIVAEHADRGPAADFSSATHANFSHRVLAEVLKTGRTYYQTMGSAPVTASLQNIEAVVAAPILDAHRNVVGIVYGSRSHGIDFRNIRQEVHESGISSLEAQVIQVLAAAVGAGLERVRQQADAMRSQMQFEQFFSTKLAEELGRDANLLVGKQREVTIVFSDLRDFSLISEHLGPAETFRMMQDLMDLQTSIIHDHDGVVVDYVGDGLLGMWNAPTNQPNHAKLACQAVLAIMRELPELNDKWRLLLNRPLQLGVGINTGDALVGNTGSRVKFKYGPMGPAVNLASRVEDASKHLGASILLTESTHRMLDATFASRRLCRASLTGVATPVDLFELSTGENTAEWRRRKQAFESALAHFSQKRWAAACLDIYPLISNADGDYDIASLQLLSRAVECMKSNPDPFDPVVHIQSKSS